LTTKYNDKINGTIMCSIKNMRVGDKKIEMASVKLICVKHSQRNKRFFEHLVNLLRNTLVDMNVHYGMFLTDRYIPIPNSKLDLYYRPLNFHKLYTCDFFKIDDKKNLEKAYNYNKNKFSLKKKKIDAVRVDESNIDKIYQLYCQYMDKFYLYENMSQKEFTDFANENMTFAMKDQKDNIVDFYIFGNCSIKHSNISLKAALLLIYSNNSVEYTPTNIVEHMSQTAFEKEYDLLLLYNNFESNVCLQEVDGQYLKTGNVSYVNFYNWKYTKLNQNQIGFL